MLLFNNKLIENIEIDCMEALQSINEKNTNTYQIQQAYWEGQGASGSLEVNFDSEEPSETFHNGVLTAS